MTMPTLLAWAETQRLGISNCPLCASFAPEDSPELINHILKHVYEFSMRALPWPAPVVHGLSRPVGTFSLPEDEDKSQRLQNWAIGTDPGRSSILQISSSDRIVSREVDEIQADPDFSGYVPIDEFFDETSSNNSSKLQVGLTELGQASEVDSLEDPIDSEAAIAAVSEGSSSNESDSIHVSHLGQESLTDPVEVDLSQQLSRGASSLERPTAHDERVNDQDDKFSQLLPMDEIAGSRPISVDFGEGVVNDGSLNKGTSTVAYRYSIGRDPGCSEYTCDWHDPTSTPD
jgi:hypothetical protein